MKRRIRIAAASLMVAAGLIGAVAAPSLGDSHNKPLYAVQCGNLSFTVTSPDHAAAGQDLFSTHVLVAPHGSVPEAQTMECTITELPGGETEAVLMLIKPAMH